MSNPAHSCMEEPLRPQSCPPSALNLSSFRHDRVSHTHTTQGPPRRPGKAARPPLTAVCSRAQGGGRSGPHPVSARPAGEARHPPGEGGLPPPPLAAACLLAACRCARRAAYHATSNRLTQGPCCHDGLSARLIERAGFDFAFMSGFCTAAARLGAPDTGACRSLLPWCRCCWARRAPGAAGDATGSCKVGPNSPC